MKLSKSIAESPDNGIKERADGRLFYHVVLHLRRDALGGVARRVLPKARYVPCVQARLDVANVTVEQSDM